MEKSKDKNAVRAVLDTNIAVSALLFDYVLTGPISAVAGGQYLADYLPYCTTARLPRKTPKIPACRDSGDLPFLQLAAHAGAAFLVTGDRDLLDVRGKMHFAIVTAEAFKSELEKLQRPD